MESEKKDKAIMDIVLYGSVSRGSEDPKDIDIIVIFSSGTLEERLNKLQRLKPKLSRINKKVDLKQMLFVDLLNPAFSGRKGVLLGISLFTSKPFAERIGFRPVSLFYYSINDKTHAEKIKFNYLLAGRGMPGILKELDGSRLAPGVIATNLSQSDIFEKILINNSISYKRIDYLESI